MDASVVIVDGRAHFRRNARRLLERRLGRPGAAKRGKVVRAGGAVRLTELAGRARAKRAARVPPA